MGLFASARQMFDGRPGSPVEDWLRRHGVMGQHGGGMGAFGTPFMDAAPFPMAGPLRSPAVAADPARGPWAAAAGPTVPPPLNRGKVAPTRLGMFGRRRNAEPLGGVNLEAALADNATKAAFAQGGKFNIGDALPGVAGGPEMAFFNKAYGPGGYAGPEQAARGGAPHLNESLNRGGDPVREYIGRTDRRNRGAVKQNAFAPTEEAARIRNIQNKQPVIDESGVSSSIVFNDQLPERPTWNWSDEQKRAIQLQIGKVKTPEELQAFARALSGGKATIGNAAEVLEEFRKTGRVGFVSDVPLPAAPPNRDGATGAAARGFADPINILDELGAAVDTIGLTGGRENIWNSDRPFLDVLNRNIDQNRSILQADERDHFEARFGGQLATGLLIPVGGGARTAGGFAKWGAGEGALAGFGAGEGNPLERAPNAAVGAGLGYAGGYSLGRGVEAVSPYITRALLRRGRGNDVEAPTPRGPRAGTPEAFSFATEPTIRSAGNRQTTISDGRPPDPKISQTAPLFNPPQKRQAVEMGFGPFGPVHPDLSDDWAAAVRRLSEDQDGEVPGALFHPEIGDISLVWGKEGTGHSDGYGLAKLLRYHANVVPELPRLIGEMEVTSRSQNRVSLASPTHQAGVRLDWDGKQKTWLITAFERLRGAPPSPDD